MSVFIPREAVEREYPISLADVRDIKKLLRFGETPEYIAKRFGIKTQTVCDIAEGRKWAWVTL